MKRSTSRKLYAGLYLLIVVLAAVIAHLVFGTWIAGLGIGVMVAAVAGGLLRERLTSSPKKE